MTESVKPNVPSDGTNIDNMAQSDNITITFNEVIDPDTITINTGSDTTCSGTIWVYLDGQGPPCLPMDSVPFTVDNRTFIFDPDGDMRKQPYRLKITSGVKDTSGNSYIETISGTFVPN